jgi:hypothetical protein
MSAKPKAVKDGIQFWPIPKTTATEAAFGLRGDAYFPRGSLPEVPREYVNQVDDLFFFGGKLPALADGVDRKEASARLQALLASFDPSNESKTATAAYALWVWSTPEIVRAAA